MSKPRKPNNFFASKPTYIWGGVVELENELTVGKELPPVVERVVAHPDDLPNLGGQIVPPMKKAPTPPTQDPST